MGPYSGSKSTAGNWWPANGYPPSLRVVSDDDGIDCQPQHDPIDAWHLPGLLDQMVAVMRPNSVLIEYRVISTNEPIVHYRGRSFELASYVFDRTLGDRILERYVDGEWSNVMSYKGGTK